MPANIKDILFIHMIMKFVVVLCYGFLQYFLIGNDSKSKGKIKIDKSYLLSIDIGNEGNNRKPWLN